MTENTQANEISPIEQYSFKFEENEVKKIHKKQLKPAVRVLIVCVVYLALVCFLRTAEKLPDVSFGIGTGIFLMYIIGYLKAIFSFRKSSKASLSAITSREYVYSVFDKALKIEIYEQGNKIAEETRGFADIQRITDLKTHFLITVMGRTFIIRKSALAEDSPLLSYLNTHSKRSKALGIVVAIALILLAIGAVASTIPDIYNDKIESEYEQALREYEQGMRTVIDRTYSDYELLTYFNVKKDGELIDVLCLVESEGTIDVLSYRKRDGENIMIEQFSDMTVYDQAVGIDLLDGSVATIGFYLFPTDIPENVSITEPVPYKGQTVYFCITFMTE